MFYYLIGLYPCDEISIATSHATAGYVESIESFEYAFNLNNRKNTFNSVELMCMTDKTLDVSDWCNFKNNIVNISCKELEAQSDIIPLVILGVLENGNKVKLASITFTRSASIPDVILVVGAPRSGTTALGDSLRKAFKCKGHGESHVAPLMQKLIETSNEYFISSAPSKNKGTLAYSVTATHIEAELLETLRRLHRSFYGDQIVIDKTPGTPMIKALPIFLRAYPQAKVLFCKRRGIENVRSRIKKFPKVGFANHCKQWSNTFSIWRQTKKLINKLVNHSNWSLEVEQFELANTPDKVVATIASHLLLNQEQQATMLNFIRSSNPQSSYVKGATSLSENGWSEDQVELFKKHCSREMKRQGYSNTQNYYLDE